MRHRIVSGLWWSKPIMKGLSVLFEMRFLCWRLYISLYLRLYISFYSISFFPFIESHFTYEKFTSLFFIKNYFLMEFFVFHFLIVASNRFKVPSRFCVIMFYVINMLQVVCIHIVRHGRFIGIIENRWLSRKYAIMRPISLHYRLILLSFHYFLFLFRRPSRKWACPFISNKNVI